jgi:hypothetical protein
VRNKSIWGALLGLKDAVGEDVVLEEASGFTLLSLNV